jgi:nicotinamidase-related amidase
MAKATPKPGKNLLSADNHVLIMIDHQSQMGFATKSIDAVNLLNNAGLVASAAKGFQISTILTTVSEKSFSGPIFSTISEAFPGEVAIDRTTMNAWEDSRITDRVNASGKSKVVICGLWTSVCIAMPALCAIEQGFEAYFIADACGDISTEAHDMSCQRMIQAGCVPMTALQYLLELQRDWARTETLGSTFAAASRFGGAYAVGLQYASTMLGTKEGK